MVVVVGKYINKPPNIKHNVQSSTGAQTASSKMTRKLNQKQTASWVFTAHTR